MGYQGRATYFGVDFLATNFLDLVFYDVFYL